MNAVEHKMFVQKRTDGTCEHGCHEHISYWFMCSCGVQRELHLLGEYWHKELRFLALVLSLEHRIEILEGLSGIKIEGDLQLKELL